MKTSEWRSGLRLIVLSAVFLALSCSTGDGEDGCLGGDGLIAGCSDGCGTGITPASDGCFGDLITGQGCAGDCLGGGGGCGGCDTGALGCGDCSADAPYSYPNNGEIVEGAIQVSATTSLFSFVNDRLLDILAAAAGDILNINPDTGVAKFCLEPISAPVIGTICGDGQTCTGGGNGCDIDINIESLRLVPVQPNRLDVRVRLNSLRADMNIDYSGCQRLELRTSGLPGSANYSDVSLPIAFEANPNNTNTQINVRGNEIGLGIVDRIDVNLTGASGWDQVGCTIGGGLSGAIVNGLLGTIVDGLIGDLAGITCRGCDNNADCGDGGQCGGNGYCTDSTGRICQPVEIGAEALVNAGGLLEDFAPGVEGQLGLLAFLGSYQDAVPGVGLQLGGRLGATADPSSMCVPFRPSPLNTSEPDSCRNGLNCPKLDELNTTNLTPIPPGGSAADQEPFHVGAGVAMSGLNLALWQVYNSGLLCLSVDTAQLGPDLLGGTSIDTSLISVFLPSIRAVTGNQPMPLLLQLRPQQEPRVDFKPSDSNGATLEVQIPQLSIDFYTTIEERYTKLFTATLDIALPLSVMASGSEVSIAIGDLADLINPETVVVSDVTVLPPTEVESLINSLPTLIGSLGGDLLGDAIPPVDIPSFAGISVQFVGPGLTILTEDDQPGALALFTRLDIDTDELGGIFDNMQPLVEEVSINLEEPNQLRARVTRQIAEGTPASYRDLMPDVQVRMGTEGIPLSEAEFAYRINGGLWSYWHDGPVIDIDDPTIAAEGHFEIEVRVRERGNASNGSNIFDSFSFTNDYTAPVVNLGRDGALATLDVRDNVYGNDDLTFRYRINGGEWTESTATLEGIDLSAWLDFGDDVEMDMQVEDPSGNIRTVRRNYTAEAANADAAAGDDVLFSDESGEGAGCSTTSGQGTGLWAALAILGLFVAGRRRANKWTLVGLAAIVALALFSAGCGDKDSGGAKCDPECGAGQFCDAGVCEFLACDGPEDCPSGTTCVDGFCSGLVCNTASDCPDDQVCIDGICGPIQCSVEADCAGTSCDEGLPLCDEGVCVCEDEISLSSHGQYLNLGTDSSRDNVYALAYNSTFGDVIFTEVGTEGQTNWTFIDGVPTDAEPSAPAAGLRGGISEDGPDAGRYLSMVVGSDEGGAPVIHAAYAYQADEDSPPTLRYLRGEQGESGWDWSTVDVDTTANTGLYTSIFLDPATGNVGIVYQAANIVNDTVVPVQYFTEVRLVMANTPLPTAAEDFALNVVLDDGEHGEPCGGLCTGRDVCVTATNTCASGGIEGCDPACEEGQICADVGGTPTCSDSTPAVGTVLPELVQGKYISADVTTDGTLHVAHYDAVFGNLKYLTVNTTDGTVLSEEILDGETAGGEDLGNVGRFPHVYMIPGAEGSPDTLVIAYEDVSRGNLMAAVIVPGGSVNRIEMLDDGYFTDVDNTIVEMNRVGADPHSVVGTDALSVFYQDATTGDIKVIAWADLGTSAGEPEIALDAVPADGLSRDDADSTDHGAFGFYNAAVDANFGMVFGSYRFSNAFPGVVRQAVIRVIPAEQPEEPAEPAEPVDPGAGE